MADMLTWIAVAARIVLVPLFCRMTFLFRSRYKQENNQYFLGFYIFFIIAFITQLGVSIVDILSALAVGPDMHTGAPFPGFEENEDKLWIVANLVRPAYLLIIIVLLIALGSQVQPLEVIVRSRFRPISRTLFALVPAVLLIYIPLLTYTIYTVVVITVSNIFIILGFAYNIIINLRLTAKSVGEVQKRFFFVMLGFLFFFTGTMWGMRVGWAKAIYSGFNSYDWDVIFGSLISALSVFLYYKGFKIED